MKILILNGPNLNMLGKREPEIYGKETLQDLENILNNEASNLNCTLEFFQSNHEGEIIDKIQQTDANGILLNAGAYTHTSIAIRDAISSVKKPVIEIHLSNIHSRDEFRHKSFIAPVCIGQICGFKFDSYVLGLNGIIRHLSTVSK